MNSDHKNIIQALILPLSMVVMTLVSSCQKKDVMCYQPTEATARIGFSQRLIIDVDTFIDSVLVDTTLVYYRDTAMPYLQAFYDDGVTAFEVTAGEAVNTISLLLNPNETSTRYFISFDTLSAVRDTLIIDYQNHPIFISNDCGFTNFYTIENVTMLSSGIDSMHINDREVTMDNANNKRHVVFYYFNE